MTPIFHESVTPNHGRHCMVEFLDMHFLAVILESEFNNFQACIPEMRDWPTYDDFLMDREGQFIGMSWAGLDVFQVDVSLRLFMRWVDLTGSHCSLQDLDDFAMRRWLRARHPEWNLRVVRAKATSPAGDRNGHLYIPVCLGASEAWQERDLSAQSDGAFNHVLAGVIAKECLDPVG